MSTITQNPPMPRDGNMNIAPLYNYLNITTTATTLVKSGAGFLHAIVFNKPASTGTVKIDDALTDTTPVIGTITSGDALPRTVIYDLQFNNGLTIVTGTAAQDITVIYY